jgi:hypothetical protein
MQRRQYLIEMKPASADLSSANIVGYLLEKVELLLMTTTQEEQT